MNNSSRLDAARADQSTGAEWYRSPVALVAGMILFLAALALVVLAFTGGDDTAAEVDTTAQDSSTQSGAASQAEAAPGEPAPDAPVDLTPLTFGGPGIPEVDDVTFVGDPLPPYSPEGVDPAVGTLAPQITATSLGSGSPITLGPGRARVIAFLAHWCPHCQDELPELTEWLSDNRLPPNTEFVAVSTAVDQGSGNYPPSDWFTAEGFPAPVVVDDANSTLLNAMGFGGFPAFIAIDASGVVVARAGGNVGTDGFDALVAPFAS